MLASHFGHSAIVKHLLKNGAELEAKAEGLTSLVHAIEAQHVVVVKLLFEQEAMVDYHFEAVSETNLAGGHDS